MDNIIQKFMRKQFDPRILPEVTVDPVKVAALTNYTEDIEDIDSNYPTTDELDNMDSFLSHYLCFVNKVDQRFVDTDAVALYAVYLASWGDES